MKRNALLRSLAPGCRDTPPDACCVEWTVLRTAFRKRLTKDIVTLASSQGFPSPCEQSPQGRHAGCPGLPPSANWRERESRTAAFTAAFTLPPVGHTFLILVSSCCLPGLLISKVICTLLNESARLCPVQRRCQLPSCD